jgi:uncharacterized protein
MSSGNWKELFDAACAGEMDLVRYHIRSGVNINHIHPEYFGTILVACILAKQQDVALELLANGANPHQYSELDGMRPLQAAKQAKLRVVEQELLHLGAQELPPAQPRAILSKWRLPFWGRRAT